MQVETVEVVGLDEAYLDLSGLERPNAAARRVKAAVTRRTGLGCSIGIGPNKLVAKVASDADKPDGFLALTAAEARERFAGRSPRLLPGIGPQTAERLEARGVRDAGRSWRRSPSDAHRVVRRRGWAPTWARLARFEDERPLETDRVRKSESRETTFDTDLRGLEQLEPALERLAGAAVRTTLSATAAAAARWASRCALDDFSTHTRARTLTAR